MKYIVYLLVIISLLLGLFSCTKDDDESSYRYPLKIGNTWTMRFSFYYYNQELSSMVTEYDTMHVWIDSLTTSPQNELCYCMRYRYNTYPADEFSYVFLVNREDGLYELGDRGTFQIPPLKGSHQIPLGLFYPRLQPKSEGESIQWLNVPRKIIPYPIENVTTWDYNGVGDDYYAPLSCTMMGKEDVTVPYGTLSCFKKKTTCTIRYSWDYYEYYSSKGIVKFICEGTGEITDDQGNSLGEYPWSEKLELLSCQLH